MKRKKYEKPTWGVIEMRQRMELLVGSNGDAGLQNYNWSSPGEE